MEFRRWCYAAKGVSLVDEEFERPMIVVVYTYQDFLPENLYFRQVADAHVIFRHTRQTASWNVRHPVRLLMRKGGDYAQFMQ